MAIFLFILGLLIGFGTKLAADYYVEWSNNQKKTADKMEDLLIKFKAIELNKKL